MSTRNRILVKESSLVNFFKSFFKAKADNKESDWLAKVRRQDPKIADAFKQYDEYLSRSMKRQRDILISMGIDTTDTDNLIKKLGLKQ